MFLSPDCKTSLAQYQELVRSAVSLASDLPLPWHLHHALRGNTGISWSHTISFPRHSLRTTAMCHKQRLFYSCAVSAGFGGRSASAASRVQRFIRTRFPSTRLTCSRAAQALLTLAGQPGRTGVADRTPREVGECPERGHDRFAFLQSPRPHRQGQRRSNSLSKR